LHFTIHFDPATLPADAAALCDDPREGTLFRSLPWLVRALPAGLLPGDQLRLYLLSETDAPDAAPVALLPAVYSRLYGSHPGARVLHFLQREEYPYSPIGPDAHATVVADCVAAWLKANPQAFDVVRVSPLDPGSPFTPAIIAALRRHGMWVQLYNHARNRFADVGGMSAAEYLEQRPRALRETLDLNTRLLMQGGRGEFHFPCTPELVEDAWGTVMRVVDRNPPDVAVEPPDYLRAVIDTAAATGTLRLGIFMLDGQPAAMQLWVINARTARCLRIWEAEDRRTFPIDEILTQLMAVCLIDGDRVERLEFGEINEEFAAEWAPGASDRLGLAAFNRHTWKGRSGALRHIVLPRLMAPVTRLWRRLRPRR
jgi:Acetyltransferase (GNAT) domain